MSLALGAGYLTAGLGEVAAAHHRAERIVRVTGGGLSEAVLQREMNGLDTAALKVARAHDPMLADAAVDGARGWAGEAWPGRVGARQAAGVRGAALQGARDLDCLTEAVYFEARGETQRGQQAVAQVVLNRVASPSYPKTVCGVVFQGAATHDCQFSFACDGAMRQGLEADAWDRARHVAERALSGAVLGDIGAATHFHAIGVQPAWGPQMLRVAQVGLHVFYRFNPHAPAIREEAPAERAVFTSLPSGPNGLGPSNLRLATAVLQKAADVTAQATAPAPAVEASAASAAATDTVAVAKAPAEGGER